MQRPDVRRPPPTSRRVRYATVRCVAWTPRLYLWRCSNCGPRATAHCRTLGRTLHASANATGAIAGRRGDARRAATRRPTKTIDRASRARRHGAGVGTNAAKLSLAELKLWAAQNGTFSQIRRRPPGVVWDGSERFVKKNASHVATYRSNSETPRSEFIKRRQASKSLKRQFLP